MDPEDVQNDKLRSQLVVEAIYKPFKGSEIPVDTENSNEVQKAPDHCRLYKMQRFYLTVDFRVLEY